MYQRGKYIAGEIKSAAGHMAVFAAVCFTETIAHEDMGPVFESIRSAGFFTVSSYGGETIVSVDGESVGLGVSSDGIRDVLQIQKALGLL